MSKIDNWPETVEGMIACGGSYEYRFKTIPSPENELVQWWRCEMIHTDQIKTGEGDSVKTALENAWSAPIETIKGWGK